MAAVRGECARTSRSIVHDLSQILNLNRWIMLARFHALCFLARGSCFIRKEFYLSGIQVEPNHYIIPQRNPSAIIPSKYTILPFKVNYKRLNIFAF